MKSLFSVIMFFIPHPMGTRIRRILYRKIHPSAKIHAFSFIVGNDISIGERVTISPFTIIRANKIEIGSFSHIAPFSIISSGLLEGSDFKLGQHSRIFPFCWLEPGEGITIGNHVGIGGHSLIFTHSSWTNYLRGGPVSFGPVEIEDHTWLPWRVFVLPNVKIGQWVIVGANSTVTKNLDANCMYAGTPAKKIRENINQELDPSAFVERTDRLFDEYLKYHLRAYRKPSKLRREDVHFYNSSRKESELATAKININNTNYTYHMNEKNIEESRFIMYLRRYGIRVNKI